MSNPGDEGRGVGPQGPSDIGALFEELVEVMGLLRERCPWDRAQDLASIKDYFLEEAHEAYEAAQRGDWEALGEELGDVLFEVAFLQRLAQEAVGLRMEEILLGILDKLRRRHPHVFGGVEVRDAEEVARNWRAIKAREQEGRRTPLDGVPRSLPPLLQAQRFWERRDAGRRGRAAWEEVVSAWRSFEESLGRSDPQAARAALGILLLRLVGVACEAGLSAHDVLVATLDELRTAASSGERAEPSRGSGPGDGDETPID